MANKLNNLQSKNSDLMDPSMLDNLKTPDGHTLREIIDRIIEVSNKIAKEFKLDASLVVADFLRDLSIMIDPKNLEKLGNSELDVLTRAFHDQCLQMIAIENEIGRMFGAEGDVSNWGTYIDRWMETPTSQFIGMLHQAIDRPLLDNPLNKYKKIAKEEKPAIEEEYREDVAYRHWEEIIKELDKRNIKYKLIEDPNQVYDDECLELISINDEEMFGLFKYKSGSVYKFETFDICAGEDLVSISNDGSFDAKKIVDKYISKESPIIEEQYVINFKARNGEEYSSKPMSLKEAQEKIDEYNEKYSYAVISDYIPLKEGSRNQKLPHVEAAIKELNSPNKDTPTSLTKKNDFEFDDMDGLRDEDLYSPFDFKLWFDDDMGVWKIADRNEVYHYSYAEDKYYMALDAADEFGFKAPKRDEIKDEVKDKLEVAIKKDLGDDAYIDWEDNVVMIISQ